MAAARPGADQHRRKRRADVARDAAHVAQQTVLLGTQHTNTQAYGDVYVGDFLPWDARLVQLERAHDFLGALQHGLELYQGHGLGSAIGLPTAPHEQKAAIGARLEQLAQAAAYALFHTPEAFEDVHAARPMLARTCALIAITTHRFDWLFGELYMLYETHQLEAVFVHEMEQFILHGEMPTPSPDIMQRLLSFRVRKHEYACVEALVLHVDPMHLDLNQTLSLCTEHRLWDAYTYICTRALHDYTTPLQVLLQRVYANTQGEAAPDAYHLFPFLASAARGVQHPTQTPLHDADRVAAARMYGILLAHDASAFLIPSTQPYPYLRMLLQLDAESLLDVLDLALEADMFDDADGILALTRRDVIDALLQVRSELVPDDEAFVALFVARNSAKYPQFLRLEHEEVRALFQVLTRLHNTPGPADCEFGLECMFSAHAYVFDDAAVQALADAHYWRVYEYALRKTQRYGDLLRFYLLDQDGEHHTPHQLYSRVVELLHLPTLPDRATLFPVLRDAMPQMPDSLLGDVARIVAQFYPTEIDTALATLNDAPRRQYVYLSYFFRHDLPPGLSENSRHTWLVLVAQFSPTMLVSQLRTHPRDFFGLHDALCVAREYRVYDAVLWLQDQLGQPAEVMDTLDAQIAENTVSLLALAAQCQEGPASGTERARAQAHETLQSFRATVRMSIQLAVEHAVHLRKDARETWFRVLRALVHYLHGLTDPTLGDNGALLPMAREAGDALMQEALAALLTSVPSETVSFPDLFRRLVETPESAAHVSYADVRCILDGMLTAYQLRCDVLTLGVRLNEADTARLFHELTKQRAMGWLVEKHPRCEACQQRILTHAGALTLTPSGHVYHRTCLEGCAQNDAANVDCPHVDA